MPYGQRASYAHPLTIIREHGGCFLFWAGPQAVDVPDDNTLSIKDFFDSYARRRDEAAYRAAHTSVAVNDSPSDSKTTSASSVIGAQCASLPAWAFPAPEPLRVAV
jgi:hypothetical protein